MYVHKFDYRFLKDLKVDSDILNRAVNIESLIGRTVKGGKTVPSVLEGLERKAIIMSVADSNAIEGIRTSETRLIGLMSDRTAPRGHDEAEIAGYRDALRFIHAHHAEMVLNKETVLELYHTLMSFSDTEDSGFKTRDNVIVDRDAEGNVLHVYPTVPKEETEKAIDQAIWSFWEARNDFGINKLLLIPCFIMDFLRIHPFVDGNGRMSRLLTTLLLYQEGYDICRYVSMESKINASKQDYYHALEDSQIGWFENENDYIPFISYFLGQLFLCYREFDRALGIELSASKKSNALEVYLRLSNLPVSKRDLMSLFPYLSESTVELVLKRMSDAGELEKVGAARSTRYVNRKKWRRERDSNSRGQRPAVFETAALPGWAISAYPSLSFPFI